jgi:hypothetical protein
MNGNACTIEEDSTMADFVIVIAAAAIGLAAPASPVPSPAEAALVPLTAPTVGFRTYPDAASCEKAVAALAAPQPGRRHICLPVERPLGELANAH